MFYPRYATGIRQLVWAIGEPILFASYTSDKLCISSMVSGISWY